MMLPQGVRGHVRGRAMQEQKPVLCKMLLTRGARGHVSGHAMQDQMPVLCTDDARCSARLTTVEESERDMLCKRKRVVREYARKK